MNSQQKGAWFTLTVLCLIGAGVLALALTFGVTMRFVGWAILWAGALSGCPILITIVRREKWDERDEAINRRAAAIGAAAAVAAFFCGVIAIMVVYDSLGQGQVPLALVGYLFFASMVALQAARSITILILYGRHVEADHA